MSQFLFELDVEKLVDLYSFCIQAGGKLQHLVYVIMAPTGKNDIPLAHKIIGLVDRYNGNYHVPTIECLYCGVMDNVRFSKQGDANYVSCSQCGVSYTCILQIPTGPVLNAVLNRIDPDKYPILDENSSSPIEKIKNFLLKISHQR